MESSRVVEPIAVDLIDPSPAQNRVVFDPVALEELAASIRELGLLQPIVVRPRGERFELIAGERRLRAVKLTGEPKVDCMVRYDSDEAAALSTLVENMVRVDPSPLEEAAGLRASMDAYGFSVTDLAGKVSKPARWVRERLALLGLAPDVAHYVATGSLPLNRAVSMSTLDVNRQRLALAAHERGLKPDAFKALVARLADEQAQDSMFDTDSFLSVEEYVVDAKNAVETEPIASGATESLVREQPLGIEEIAVLLGVKRQTVDQWRRRGILVDPDFVVSGSPLWWASSIESWAARTGRG